MFSDNYIALCANEGKHITTVAEEIGYSRTSGIKWANGSIPRKATLKKIADYFSVTVGDLLSDNEKPAPAKGVGGVEPRSGSNPDFSAKHRKTLEFQWFQGFFFFTNSIKQKRKK